MIRERLGMLFLSFVSFIFRIKDEELTKEEKDRLMREYYAKQWSKGSNNSIVASYNTKDVQDIEKSKSKIVKYSKHTQTQTQVNFTK